MGTTGELSARRVEDGLAVPVVDALRTLDDDESNALDGAGAGVPGAEVDDADAGVFFFLAILAPQHVSRRCASETQRDFASRVARHCSSALLAARLCRLTP